MQYKIFTNMSRWLKLKSRWPFELLLWIGRIYICTFLSVSCFFIPISHTSLLPCTYLLNQQYAKLWIVHFHLLPYLLEVLTVSLIGQLSDETSEGGLFSFLLSLCPCVFFVCQFPLKENCFQSCFSISAIVSVCLVRLLMFL